jgi:hypothetical protein
MYYYLVCTYKEFSRFLCARKVRPLNSLNPQPSLFFFVDTNSFPYAFSRYLSLGVNIAAIILRLCLVNTFDEEGMVTKHPETESNGA